MGSEMSDSARSSLSEVSAVSNASTKTYLDEASTLVLEAIENGIKKYVFKSSDLALLTVIESALCLQCCSRHYLIPMALAEKRKWKKKGVKLHIYSDHVFVAKHIPG